MNLAKLKDWIKFWIYSNLDSSGLVGTSFFGMDMSKSELLVT